ncbi:alpha/beta hydrolase [Streptomyces sp. NPDC046465]|uniref:alpha/beta hydrolase n=1 Tax=Streptomyces sp. NPDC046465 TaxID=3155810 RepID=UPI0033CBF426
MTKTKRTVTLLAASAAALTLTTPLAASASSTTATSATSATTATTATRMPAAALDWTPCAGHGPDSRQECATLDVPMDYAHPDGEKIEIAISRIRSEKPSARRGALLLIPGGPGGSGIDAPSRKGQKLPQSVRDSHDLIGLDPRGLGRSTPVTCGFEHADLATSRLRPWPAPDGSVTENMAIAKRTADACARNGGELLRHISTADNARDIDRIRAALGEEKLSAWAVSYGTYVGAVYSQLFPRRTDRIVLDSNDDPDPARVGRGWLAAHERGVEDTFPEFAAWAATPGNKYRLARTAAEVRPLFLRLAARLDRAPIPWEGANPAELNGNVLRQTMLNAMDDPDDFPALAQLILGAQEGSLPSAPPAPPEEAVQNTVAVGSATLCNDVAWPRSAAGYQKGAAASRAAFPLTAGMPRNAMLCAAWPFEPKGAPVRISDRGPSNILLVQNERDPNTPLAGARKLREALGRRATMVTVDATGHDSYLANGNACGDRTVSRFLATGERPDHDTYCS